MKIKLSIPGTELEYEGSERFLETKVPDLFEMVYQSRYELLKRDLLAISDDLQRKLTGLSGLELDIKSFEDELNTIGDDAQLANIDLQNMMQKQQQTLQQMSNISKMLHDTAMAVIRKIGG